MLTGNKCRISFGYALPCSDTSHIAQPTGACGRSAFWLMRQVNLAWTYFVSGNCYCGGAQAVILVEKADLFEPDIHYVRRGSDVLDTSVSSGSWKIDYLGFPHRAGQMHLFSATSQVPACLSAWSLDGDS